MHPKFILIIINFVQKMLINLYVPHSKPKS
jgi:hypothetical protein